MWIFFAKRYIILSVKWNSKNSTDFTVSNGVKQGAVIPQFCLGSFRVKSPQKNEI